MAKPPGAMRLKPFGFVDTETLSESTGKVIVNLEVIMNYACPCCGYKTLTEAQPGTYDICEICFWEVDGVQYRDPDYYGGANKVSLREAQTNYIKLGACEERCVKFVRRPTDSDVFEGPKDISKIQRMPINEIIKIFLATGTPIEDVLDIYKGLIHIKDSNFVFNSGQLEDYISLDESRIYHVSKPG